MDIHEARFLRPPTCDWSKWWPMVPDVRDPEIAQHLHHVVGCDGMIPPRTYLALHQRGIALECEFSFYPLIILFLNGFFHRIYMFFFSPDPVKHFLEKNSSVDTRGEKVQTTTRDGQVEISGISKVSFVSPCVSFLPSH